MSVPFRRKVGGGGGVGRFPVRLLVSIVFNSSAPEAPFRAFGASSDRAPFVNVHTSLQVLNDPKHVPPTAHGDAWVISSEDLLNHGNVMPRGLHGLGVPRRVEFHSLDSAPVVYVTQSVKQITSSSPSGGLTIFSKNGKII